MTLGISFNFSRSQLSWDCMGAVKNTEIIYQPLKAWYLLVLPKCPQHLPSACSWHPYPMLQDRPPGRCSKGYSLKHSRFFPGICLCFSYLQKKKVGAPSRRMAESRGSSSHWLECHSCISWGRLCPADPTLAFRVGLTMQTGITVKTMTHRWSQNNVLKTSVSSGQWDVKGWELLFYYSEHLPSKGSVLYKICLVIWLSIAFAPGVKEMTPGFMSREKLYS